jgi:predicted alpha/beta hydrolase family esterase
MIHAMGHDRLSRTPLCLTLPGLGGSGPDHWQTLWEKQRRDVERVELGSWSQPSRNIWIAKLEQALARAPGPVVLVAHSLGCHLVSWWASMTGEGAAGRVVGAMLVAPPDLERVPVDRRLAEFWPSPRGVLPFPAVVVASHDDPWCSFARAREMASAWLAAVCDAGEVGHINAESGLGAWEDGQRVLDRLLDHVCAGDQPRLNDAAVRYRPEVAAALPA